MAAKIGWSAVGPGGTGPGGCGARAGSGTSLL